MNCVECYNAMIATQSNGGYDFTCTNCGWVLEGGAEDECCKVLYEDL